MSPTAPVAPGMSRRGYVWNATGAPLLATTKRTSHCLSHPKQILATRESSTTNCRVVNPQLITPTSTRRFVSASCPETRCRAKATDPVRETKLAIFDSPLATYSDSPASSRTYVTLITGTLPSNSASSQPTNRLCAIKSGGRIR